MNNSQDPKFSKFSYVDKDFASIYPDLLDLATTLTDKWHPANSNESDPGVVLLKEGAFMADHINYNTDKNILEAFLPTATQESSVRDLVERGGYLPDYYVSGKGKVNFTCVINDENKPLINSIIPSLTLNITNKDGTVWYVQTDPLKIDESGHGNCNFIEGYIEDLEINGSKNITLENIDDDLRLYLPVKNVAQNGIFIRNSEINEKTDWSYDLWKREVFLNVLPQYTKAYRVEYDSEKDKVYIEFPSDISAIIGSGLNIKYIVSSGLRGNVPANHLTVISSPTSIKIGENDYSMSNFTLYNPGAIDSGKDPETIKEMYHNFKETVGTFNTLVTCQDYSNAIKSMVDDNNIHIVSNAVVTDCTNDYSNAVNIVTYDEYGKYVKPALKRDLEKIFEEINGKYSGSINISDVETFSKFVSLLQKYEGMKNNDLKLCALQAYNAGKYQWDKPEACMETTYKPILPQYTLDVVKDGEITLTGIKESLKDYKCVSTSFKSKLDGEIYYFKVKTPLHIQVTTYEKITSKTELESIQQSIYRTITEKYNSGMIEFGESLDLDEVYQAILNADERIKNIYITQEDDEAETVAVRLSSENNEPTLKEDVIDITTEVGKDLLLELVAKNVLAGRLCLFNFITDFKYNYGQAENIFYGQSGDKLNPSTSSSSSIDDKINSINTNTKIFISNLVTSNDQFTILPTDYVSINFPEGFSHSPIKNNSTVIISLSENKAITLTYDSTKILNPINLKNNIGVTNITGRDIEFNSDALGLIFYQFESKENQILSPEFSTTINMDNHYLYIAKPNYMDDQVFPTYCYYKLVGNISYGQEGFEDIVIPANTDTVIPNGYTLYLSYKKDGVNEIKAYPAGTTVLSTIDISLKDFYQAPSTEQGGDRKKLSESNRRYLSSLGVTNGDGFRIISAGNSIRTRILLRTSIKNRTLPCYWIRSNPGCTLFNYIISNGDKIEPTDSNTFIYNGEVCTILNNNEYFFYTDQERHDLVMFGPGTMVSITEEYAVRVKTKDNYSWGINPEDQLSLEGIETKGINAGIPFIELNLTPESKNNTYELNLTEMEITTLDKNDSFTLSLTNKKYIDNISEFLTEPLEGFSFGFGTTWYPIFKAGKLTYSLTEDQENINSDISTDIGVFIKTEFLISSNPILLNNYKDDNCYTTEEIDYNIDEVISSGELINDPVKVMSNIDLSGLSSSSIAMNSNNYDVDLRLMKYKAEKIIFHKTDGDDGYLYPGDMSVPANYKETSDYEELSFSSNYNLGSSFTLTVPFFFNRGCKAPGVIDPTAGDNNDTAPDLHNNYIIPVLLSSDYKKLAGNLSAQVLYSTNGTSIPLKIYEFGKDFLNEVFGFNTNTNFYQLTFDIDNTEIKEDTELELVFSYNSDNAYNPNFELDGSTVRWNTETSFNSILLYKSGVTDPLIINNNDGEYNISDSGDYGYPGEYVFTLETDTDIYLFEFDLTSKGSSTYQRTSSQSLQSSYEMIVKVLPIKVYNGANKKIALSDNSLDDIVKKMNYLVYNSSEPNTNIYYINEPDNTIDIQDEEILIPNTTVFNPNFLYDKNNIANNQVLPMIDIKNTEIFLTKSVKGYRE